MPPASWRRWRAALAHAFAVDHPAEPLAPEDVALLDRIATAVVRRGLAAPAILFLETVGPLSFLGSQALYGIAPLLDVIGTAAEAQRLATILERRDAVAILHSRIEGVAALACGGAPPPSPGPEGG
jgi:hypothetical protein